MVQRDPASSDAFVLTAPRHSLSVVPLRRHRHGVDLGLPLGAERSGSV